MGTIGIEMRGPIRSLDQKMSESKRIWDLLDMNEGDFRIMINDQDTAGLMVRTLDPMSNIWNSFRQRQMQTDSGTHHGEFVARDHAATAVTLVKWILGGEDPDIWIENLRKVGTTSTCNYVSCFRISCNTNNFRMLCMTLTLIPYFLLMVCSVFCRFSKKTM